MKQFIFEWMAKGFLLTFGAVTYITLHNLLIGARESIVTFLFRK